MRGINVGGKNSLPMKELAAIFADLGCQSVRTYIQSGNVVFEATSAVARKLPAEVAAKIREKFGLQVPVVLRSREEMEQLISANPFLADGIPEKALHVMFLAGSPTADAVAALDARRSAGDEFRVIGRDVYLHLPNGTARSKLTNAYFDSKLATVSTLRNWATSLAILKLMKG